MDKQKGERKKGKQRKMSDERATGTRCLCECVVKEEKHPEGERK